MELVKISFRPSHLHTFGLKRNSTDNYYYNNLNILGIGESFTECK